MAARHRHAHTRRVTPRFRRAPRPRGLHRTAVVGAAFVAALAPPMLSFWWGVFVVDPDRAAPGARAAAMAVDPSGTLAVVLAAGVRWGVPVLLAAVAAAAAVGDPVARPRWLPIPAGLIRAVWWTTTTLNLSDRPHTGAAEAPGPVRPDGPAQVAAAAIAEVTEPRVRRWRLGPRRTRPEVVPVVVEVHPDTVAVWLRTPTARPPAGWTSSPTGHRWTRAGIPNPPRTPARDVLVPLGDDTAPDAVVVNLSAARVCSVIPEPGADPVASAVIERLDTAAVDVVYVAEDSVEGEDAGRGLGGPPGRVVSWVEVAALVERRARARTTTTMAESRHRGLVVVAESWTAGGERWELLETGARAGVMFVAVNERAGAPGMQVLLGRNGRVVIPDLGLGVPVAMRGDRLGLGPLALALGPGPQPATVSASAADVVEGPTGSGPSTSPEPMGRVFALGPRTGEPEAPPASVDPPVGVSLETDPVDEAGEVWVRVLGPISVGGSGASLRPKQTAVLVFVALHPGCGADQLESAVWPDPMGTRRQRLHVTCSQIRGVVGPDRFPVADSDRCYRIGPGVRVDLDEFALLVARADTADPFEAAELLRTALSLVTGPVFSYRSVDESSFVWVDLEQWASDTEHEIAQTALALWGLCRQLGDRAGALWAARRGLLASPTDTALTNALLRSHVEAGDLPAAAQVFRSHCTALDRLGLGDPDPSTVELWEDATTVA